MSILEVLFAIMITSVGLLGAIALFPVASAQARKARNNEAAAAAGRRAVHDFDARGMRRFDRWYTWNTGTSQFAALATPAPLKSYCIDSRSIVNNTSNWNNIKTFPYTPFSYPAPLAWMDRVAFFPGKLDPGGAFAKDQFDRRNLLAVPRNRLLADSLFLLEDDLVITRPGIDDVTAMGLANDRSLPAIQRFDYNGTNPLKRQSQGHLSWMATLVPRVDASTSFTSDQYVLSIVVFYDRYTDLALSTANENIMERTVTAALQGDGSTGGEVLLSWTATQNATNDEIAAERLKLRAGDWVLLSGNVGSIGRFSWYRVAHCDAEIDYGNSVTGAYSRFATLMGQDWDTSITPQATLLEGVIAVYEKTIRLDASSTF